MPSDSPTDDVAIADKEPELVEADVLVLAAVARRCRNRIHRHAEDRVPVTDVAGWNEFTGGAETLRGRRPVSAETLNSVEDEDGVGALAAHQDVEMPAWTC